MRTRKKHRSKKKTSSVYILYTGGTIGMTYNKTMGLYPKNKLFNKLVRNLNIPHAINIKYKIESLSKIIDSSNIQSANWLEILSMLKKNYAKYDSFIIIHGTDTLAYTASMLSFFCKDWTKTIVVTGSQIPMFEFRNDAVKNIRDSIIVSQYKIPQVLIVFGDSVLRANCSTKYSSVSFNAFHSPNTVPLGVIGVNLNLNYTEIEKGNIPKNYFIKKSLPRTINISKWNNNINIIPITFTPGMLWKTKTESIFNSKLPNAIIFRSYGIGNAPSSSDDFINFLDMAYKNNIVIVNSTQCYTGGVNMTYYKTGKTLLKHNVIDARKMTFESIYTKLFYLFQVIDNKNTTLIRKLFRINIAGESPGENKYTTLKKKIKNINNHLFNQYQEI